ncbi:MAG: SlyX family protein [Planctomycetaceae bacterium]|nr:SlyX family protein [Planctomycetaceae bacterium]
MTNSEEINDKLVHLESIIAHLQYEIEQLNGVVIAQNQRIDQLSSAQEKFEHQLETLSDEMEQRNPEDERPPHY